MEEYKAITKVINDKLAQDEIMLEHYRKENDELKKEIEELKRHIESEKKIKKLEGDCNNGN